MSISLLCPPVSPEPQLSNLSWHCKCGWSLWPFLLWWQWRSMHWNHLFYLCGTELLLSSILAEWIAHQFQFSPARKITTFPFTSFSQKRESTRESRFSIARVSPSGSGWSRKEWVPLNITWQVYGSQFVGFNNPVDFPTFSLYCYFFGRHSPRCDKTLKETLVFKHFLLSQEAIFSGCSSSSTCL